MDFENLIKERFSVRKFSDKEIEQEKLDKILEAGRLAPTAGNYQPQMIYVIKSKEAKDKLNTVCKMSYGAPVVLLACADMNVVWKNPLEEGYDTSEMDASIVGTQMMLEATNLGINSIWIRYFNSESMRKEFDLPENIKPVFMMPIGYKTEDCKPHPVWHNTRKNIEDEVKYL